MLLFLLLSFSPLVQAEDEICFYGTKPVMVDGEIICKRDESLGIASSTLIGCVYPPLQYVMPKNSSFEFNHKLIECRSIRRDTDVQLIESPVETAPCENGMTHGAVWVEGLFKYRCGDYGEIKLQSCIIPSGELPTNETGRIGDLDVTCTELFNGTAVLEPEIDPKDYKCTTSTGELKLYGEEFVEQEYMVASCGERGFWTFVGCYAEIFSDTLHFGKHYRSGNLDYVCQKTDEKITLIVSKKF